MKRPLAAAALLLAVSLPAFAAPDAAFDSGVDASALAAQAKAAAKDDKTEVKAAAVALRYDRDCAVVNFAAGDPTTSAPVYLRSQEWETVCTPAGDPRRGGGQNCWDRPGMSWSQTARITLQGRPALRPWEHDTFEACLEGPWLDVYTLETAYSYRIAETGRGTGDYVAVAGARTPESPDPLGITGALDSRLALSLTDRWASYYAGERVTLKLELKKYVKFWPDATVLTKEITLPVAASYSVDFLKYASEFSAKPESGRQYYVSYSIRRLGSVSNDRWTKEIKTDKTAYAPAALAFAR